MRAAGERGWRLIVPAIYALSLCIYLIWEGHYRGVFAYSQGVYPIDDADEWRYTACSRLVAHGYSMFTQVFSAQPPLLFASLATGMRLLGDSIAGARWVEIGFGLVGLASAAWLASLLGGRLAGAATSLLLAVSPGFLVYSHTVEAEGPMMALTTLSLALAAAYARTGRRILPLLSGLILAAAVLMKLFALEATLPALWLIALYRPQGRQNVRASLLLVAALGTPLALDFGLFHAPQQWDQVVRLHEEAARASLPGVTPPAQILGRFLSLDLGLTLLGLAGFILLLGAKRWKDAGFFATWVLGSLLMLLLFRPLFPHHAAILLTGLAAAAGVGIGVAVETFNQGGGALLAPVALASILYLVLLPRLAHDDRHVLIPADLGRANALSAFVRGHTADRDLVAADDLRVADLSGRLVVPSLCDPSNVRLRAGYLTAGQLVAATVKYGPKLVLSSFGIYQQVPEYLAWLRQHYRQEPAPAGQAFLRR